MPEQDLSVEIGIADAAKWMLGRPINKVPEMKLCNIPGVFFQRLSLYIDTS